MTKAEETPITDLEPVNYAMLTDIISTPDPAKISMEMFKRVLEAPDLDKAFDVLEGKTSEDYKGKTFRFETVELEWYQPKDKEHPVPAAKCKAVDANGEVIDFWTSAGMLVSFLAKAKISNALPVTWKIVEITTAGGQKALNPERV